MQVQDPGKTVLPNRTIVERYPDEAHKAAIGAQLATASESIGQQEPATAFNHVGKHASSTRVILLEGIIEEPTPGIYYANLCFTSIYM